VLSQLTPADLASVDVAIVQDCAEWDSYVENHPAATADHLWGWRSVFVRALGQEPSYLVARRGTRLCGVLPLVKIRSLVFGRSIISLPFLNYGGILADDAESAETLIRESRRQAEAFGAPFVELRHSQRMAPHLPCRQHKLRMELALPADPATLWESLDRKVRNQVRKAQKEGLAVEIGGLDLLDEFYGIFAENMRDLGTPVYPRALFAEVLRTFPSRARIHVVRLGRQPVAAGIAFSFRKTILNPWASSLRTYRHLCPNMLLYWSMLEQAIRDGYETFDFGRSSVGAGTHQFKLQWGVSERPLNWEYVMLTGDPIPDQGPSNPRLQGVIDFWKKLPVWLTNAIGPLVARQLP
jgi:FemAB-related protein (PEP-CTERM system-associated)